MQTDLVTVAAPAKLTLYLHIVGTRHDGFHLIDAEMVSIDLVDTVTIVPESTGIPGATGIEVTGPYALGVPTDGSNLVARALQLVSRTARVTIDKRIPHGGGLGGGSTDAAAILRWAGFDDLQAAARLGADIAFCRRGGRAHVASIGEQITELPYIHRDLTLVIPPLQASTPAVYRAYDELTATGAGRADQINHLEPAALMVEPRLAIWRDRVAEITGNKPVLAGSGATWFVDGRHGNALAVLADEGAHIHEVTTMTGS